MGETASVNTASLGGCLHSSKTRARWAEEFHDELNGRVFDVERDARAPSGCTLPLSHHKMKTKSSVVLKRPPRSRDR